MPLNPGQRTALEAIRDREQARIDRQTARITRIEANSVTRVAEANAIITDATDKRDRAISLLGSPDGTKNDALVMIRLLNKDIKT